MSRPSPASLVLLVLLLAACAGPSRQVDDAAGPSSAPDRSAPGEESSPSGPPSRPSDVGPGKPLVLVGIVRSDPATGCIRLLDSNGVTFGLLGIVLSPAQEGATARVRADVRLDATDRCGIDVPVLDVVEFETVPSLPSLRR